MEYSLSLVVLATTISIIILASKFLNYYQHHTKKNLPPGPKPWPLIGNLNLIGPLPHHSFHKLSQKYGKLMHIKIGSFPVVVASSPEMAKQFLKTHDQVFASRPPNAAAKYTNYNCSNITWSPYNSYWRQGRRIYRDKIFSSERLDSFEYIRVEERRSFLTRLNAVSGNQIILKDHLFRNSLGVISRIVLGRTYVGESKDANDVFTFEEFHEMLDELFLLNGALNINDWIPWIAFLDLQGYVKRMKALSRKLDRFYEHVYKEHKARMKAEGDAFVVKDMVDSLLMSADDPNLDVKINSDAIKGLIQELVSGGTDTSVVTLEWAMSELLKQPELIKKATEELDRVIGKERWVEEKDFQQLPFIDSILKETMRLHPVAAILPPHLALEDVKVDGYDIPKDTRVFVNIWGIGRDPDVWDEPESFRPERFLGRAIDVKGQNFELLPFGSGRRMCAGYSLGLKMIRSGLANMLHGFNWKLPENMKPEDLDMEEVFGLVTFRKSPLVVVPEPRLPDYLYYK